MDFKDTLREKLEPAAENPHDLLDGEKLVRDMYYLTELQPEALKVLWLLSDTGGCGFYRGLLPAASINKNFSKEVNVVTTTFLSPEDHMVSGGSYPKWDVVVCQRSDSLRNFLTVKLIRHKLNAALVYEADDDFFHLDPKSPSYAGFPKARLDRIRDYVRACDAVTVTNEKIKAIYEELNPNVTVLPNAVDVDMFKAVRKQKDEYDRGQIIIGWTGSTTHYTDLLPFVDAIKFILNKYPQVTFLLGGWADCGFFADIPPNRIIRIPWTRNMLEHIQNVGKMDIGVCPLADNKFNESKSNLKFLELAAAGIPAIVSDVIAYGAVKDGKHGLRVKTTGKVDQHWIKAMETLINDARLRQQYGRAGFELVDAKFNVKNTARQWADFYKEVVRCKTQL